MRDHSPQEIGLMALGEQILAILRPLSVLEREKVMGVVNAEYCFHCWMAEGPHCYCTRDD